MDPKLSRITLAIAQDSGWYEVDMDSGEHYFWGKNKGCGFVNSSCPTHINEFCDENYSVSCSENHHYVTKCSKSYYTGTCKSNLNVRSCKVHHSIFDNAYRYGPDAVCLRTIVILNF
jgi:hypothetical protein